MDKIVEAFAKAVGEGKTGVAYFANPDGVDEIPPPSSDYLTKVQQHMAAAMATAVQQP